MRERTTRHTSRLVIAVGLAAATLGIAPRTASAAFLTITTTSVAIADDGQCTLPEAITAANTNTASGASSGECPAGTPGPDLISVVTGGSIAVAFGGLPAITSPMTITGGSGVTIDGTNAGDTAGLTIQSAIAVLLDSVHITGFAGGGVVATDTTLTIFDSWIEDNGGADSSFGGIYHEGSAGSGGSLLLNGSTVSDNVTAGSGGGVFVGGFAGESEISNSTIANNTAATSGGGIRYAPAPGTTLAVTHTTVVANSAPTGDGIHRTGTPSLTVTNSIVADNLGTGGDVDGTAAYTSGGGNVIGDGTNTANFNGSDDVTGQSAGVAALAMNGGPTPTMALQPGSPAIDRVTTSSTSIAQNYVSRPQGFGTDSGAYELVPRRQLTMLLDPCQAYDSGNSGGLLTQGEGPRTVQITGTCDIPDEATAVVVTVRAVDPQAPGNLRLSAAGVVPNGGVVNFTSHGLENTNTVTIDLSPTGAVDVSANGGNAPLQYPLTNVRLTAIAYYAPTAGLDYFPLTPCATFDSRPGEGATGSFEGPFDNVDLMPVIDVVGTFPTGQGGGNSDCGVPVGADAVVVNLVAVNPTGPGDLSLPGVAVVAFDDIGMNNSAVAYLDLEGGETAQITPFTNARTDVRVVVLGYLDDATNGSTYTPLTPCAAFDTRPGEGAIGPFAGLRAGNDITTYQITGAIPTEQGGNGIDCGVPTDATGILINLVAVNPILPGNLQAYATGQFATGGVVNFAPLSPPMNNANAVPIPINNPVTNGQIDIRTNAGPTGAGQPTTHIRGIILGYYTN